MLVFKYLLLSGVIASFVVAAATVVYDLFFAVEYRRAVIQIVDQMHDPVPLRWRTGLALTVIAWTPLLIAVVISR